MTIDIISYTSEQIAELTTEQLLEVRSAQRKKNVLLAERDKKIKECKQKLIDNGMMHSSAWQLMQEYYVTLYEAKVSDLREELLFYLHYLVKPETEEETNPYPLDYALSEVERYQVVKEYYETTYTDGTERFEVFKNDAVARQYLGELYATLYDVFLESV